MKKKLTDIVELSSEQAINEVLMAEKNAQQKISEYEHEVQLVLEQARQKARHISDRNNNRITRIHQRCSQFVTDQVAAMARASKLLTKDEKEEQYDITAMNTVLEQLAISLTGPEQATKKKRE